MGKWCKLENPPISDWGLFTRWAKDQKRRGVRYKVRDYNGVRYLKYKDNGELNRMWLKKWPEHSVLVTARAFYKPEFCPDDIASKFGVGEYVWAESLLDKENLRDFFIKEFGSEWEALDRAYLDKRYWVSERIPGFLMNVVQHVFVFLFKSKAEAIKFKLIYGNDS